MSGLKIIIWFIVPILIGTGLLLLPISQEKGGVSFIDALFTAASALCVTGLNVVNMPETYTVFGELVILLLIQLGGLGVMTFSTLFFMTLSGRISSGNVLDLRQTFSSRADLQVRSILKSAFLVTVLIEGIGVVFLFFPFYAYMDPLKAFYFAVFHSISAFNNAGFSISPHGLQDFHTSIPLSLSIAALVVIGGIGFIANMELTTRLKDFSQRRHASLHTKLVVVTTVALLIGGAVCFLLLEMNNAYKDYPWTLKITQAIFQSVTPRTAGFDTVSQNRLSIFSLLITIFLMIIGASPGSTGGGIKTTSFAIIVAAVVARIKGSAGVDIFKRTLTLDSLIKAVTIFILAVMLIFVATLALMLVESGFSPTAFARGMVLDYLFETVSAFGTVGLSLGLTSTLHTGGKLIIIAMMIIGRAGLLTIFYVVARPEGGDRISYSEESVMIG